MSLTSAQQQAVVARGNVLVVAGAGTGKTSTLVERCLHCLLEEKPSASLDEILMVTFTEAAAAEMRQRIRARLEQELAGSRDQLRWAEQLALFETANIGTLHSFCLQLVRQHFYELELDPQLTVLPEEEARLLADETLDSLLQAHYAGKTAADEAVRQLIQTLSRGWDVPIRALVLRLHHYTQTLGDPEGWFASQLLMFQSPEPGRWCDWLLEGVRDWRDRWMAALRAVSADNKRAAECAALLQTFSANLTREQCAELLGKARLADGNWPTGKKTAWRKPLEDFFSEAIFLESLARVSGGNDPLTEDWNWTRPQMTALLELAREFTAAFGTARRELGVVDFHDLEQHALRLLWDRATNKPTAIARQWRAKLRFVFVDEYQDINEAQDAILKGLGREGENANRFLVGDVKQSIYRFRLADPRIFQHYLESWRGVEGRAIPLVDNFRSREAILGFVNSLFGALMRREIGGVPYDDDARLRFGDPEHRGALSLACDAAPRVELHLRLKGGAAGGNAEGEGESNGALERVMNLEQSAREARLVALRLRELKAARHLVWDEASKAMRPVEWGDMAVLLRSPSGKAESYAREFSRCGVPLLVARGGFYESLEITDLLSLLQLLDNPLQDLPALAVLRSPLVGFSLDELATIRIGLPKGHFWTALQRYHETNPAHSGRAKADRFLKNFRAWRRVARQVSLSRCLEAVLEETHYAAWLLTQPRGDQRRANVQRLLGLARQFDQFQRQGLFRFLRFIEAQQAAETEPDVAAVAGADSVSLMSIHQSKGLEFPVVVVADLGKPFNLSDLRAEIILDSEYGLCPHIKPAHTGRRYPSLPYWLAQRRQEQETLGEELRLLYVAATRARDTLILSGQMSESKFEKQWCRAGARTEIQPEKRKRATPLPGPLPTPSSRGEGEEGAAAVRNTASIEVKPVSDALILSAKNYLDWIGAWVANAPEHFPGSPEGESWLWRWTHYEELDARLLDDPARAEIALDFDELAAPLDDAAWDKLRGRLAWKYPHLEATHEAAKKSVSALRRQLADENADESAQFFPFQRGSPGARPEPRGKPASNELSATEIGTAHHEFLRLVSLEKAAIAAELRMEAQRMEKAGALSADEIKQLDLTAIAAFWQSELGAEIRERARNVRRELEFTARFAPGELAGLGGPATELADEEFIVVQGIADLAVLLPKEIWLVDFKTDRVSADELPARVKTYEPQMKLYALALERIHRRPVKRSYLHFLAVSKSVAVKW